MSMSVLIVNCCMSNFAFASADALASRTLRSGWKAALAGRTLRADTVESALAGRTLRGGAGEGALAGMTLQGGGATPRRRGGW